MEKIFNWTDTRSVDDLGRVVLPKALRAKLGIAEGDEVSFAESEGYIVLRRATPCCSVCRSLEDLTLLGEGSTAICAQCVEKIKAL